MFSLKKVLNFEMELAINDVSEYLRGVLLPAPEYGVCPVRALLPHLD